MGVQLWEKAGADPAKSIEEDRMLRRMLIVATLMALTVAMAAPALAHRDAHRRSGHDRHSEVDHRGSRHGQVHWELAKVRRSTARFHRISKVERAGYQLGYIEPFLLDGCIAHETDGAMGFHYFNHDMIHDTQLDPRRPEGIVYAPTRRGKLRLAAVEWIVPQELWEAEGNTEPPELLGQELHILNEALGWYILHAWVWMYNPSGVFSDWNPRVDCG